MSTETDRETLERRLDSLEARVDDMESAAARRDDRLDELDAGQQAVRGFLGGVDAVNEAVERRADAAIAAVERLEAATVTDRDVTGSETDSDHVSDDNSHRITSDDSHRVSNEPSTTTNDDADSAEATGAPSASLRDRLRNLR